MGRGIYKIVRKHAIAAGLGEQGQEKLEAVLFLGSSTRSEPPAATNPLEHEAGIARVQDWLGVLRGQTALITAYVDTSRVETKVANYPVAVWVLFDMMQPQRLPPGTIEGYPNATPLLSQLSMHFNLDCRRERVRVSEMDFYDSTGVPHPRVLPLSEGPDVAFTDNKYANQALLRSICVWLSNPATPPIIVNGS